MDFIANANNLCKLAQKHTLSRKCARFHKNKGSDLASSTSKVFLSTDQLAIRCCVPSLHAAFLLIASKQNAMFCYCVDFGVWLLSTKVLACSTFFTKYSVRLNRCYFGHFLKDCCYVFHQMDIIGTPVCQICLLVKKTWFNSIPLIHFTHLLTYIHWCLHDTYVIYPFNLCESNIW